MNIKIIIPIALICFSAQSISFCKDIRQLGVVTFPDSEQTSEADLTDNTLAIQAALDSSESNIQFPSVTGESYKFNGTLTIPSGKVIYDYGVLRYTGPAGAAIEITGDDVFLMDVFVVGPYTNQYVESSVGVKMAAANGSFLDSVTLKNVKIRNFGESGLFAKNISNSLIKYCLIEDIGVYGMLFYGAKDTIITANTVRDLSPGLPSSNNMYGISLTRSADANGTLQSDPPSENCEISYNTVSRVSFWKGLDSHGGRNLIFHNNVVTECQIGIGIDEGDSSGGGPSAPPSDIQIIDNLIDNKSGTSTVGPGIILVAADGGANIGDNGYISGNVIRNHGSSDSVNLPFGAITCVNWKSITIIGNKVVDSYRSAINLRGTVKDAYLSNNVIHDMSSLSVTRLAFLFESASIDVTIDNNVFLESSGIYTAYSSTFLPLQGFGTKIGNHEDYFGQLAIWKSGSYYQSVALP